MGPVSWPPPLPGWPAVAGWAEPCLSGHMGVRRRAARETNLCAAQRNQPHKLSPNSNNQSPAGPLVLHILLQCLQAGCYSTPLPAAAYPARRRRRPLLRRHCGGEWRPLESADPRYERTAEGVCAMTPISVPCHERKQSACRAMSKCAMKPTGMGWWRAGQPASQPPEPASHRLPNLPQTKRKHQLAFCSEYRSAGRSPFMTSHPLSAHCERDR